MTQAQTLNAVEIEDKDDLHKLSSYSALKAAFTEATGQEPSLKEKFICAGIVAVSPVLKPAIRYVSRSLSCSGLVSGGY
jgi:hypothetical protein